MLVLVIWYLLPKQSDVGRESGIVVLPSYSFTDGNINISVLRQTFIPSGTFILPSIWRLVVSMPGGKSTQFLP
jgi:hypothetical protein